MQNVVVVKPKKILSGIVEEIFKDCSIKSGYRGFRWLKSKNGYNMEIDIWVPDIKLAIEYDGEGHFWPIRFHNCSDEAAKKNFAGVQERDALKAKLISENKDKVENFIRFDYRDKKKLTREFVYNRLIKEGVEI